MLTPLTVVGLAGLLCVLAYRYFIFPALLSPLSGLPNAHPLCSTTNLWLRWQRRRLSESKSIFAAHQRHGDIIRVGPQELSVNSLEGLRKIYTAGLEKSTFYINAFEHYGTTNLFTTPDHRTHSVHKRMISRVYTKSYVQNSDDVATFSKVITLDRFLPLLKQYASANKAMNVMDLFSWTGIDFIGAYLFGSARSTNFLQDTASAKAYSADWAPFRDGLTREKKGVEKVCWDMLQKTLQDEQNGVASEGTNAVVALLMYSQLQQKAKGESTQVSQEAVMKRCASELLDHIVATHETFAITMTYLIYRMSLDSAMQTALRRELLTLKPPVSHPTAAHTLPTADELDDLPLLSAVLLETLRLHAPTPVGLPRISPPGGTVIHGHFIPAGTVVSCNAYSLHRKPEVFPRAVEWLPQRWIPAEQRASLGGPHSFPPPEVSRKYMWAFGSGARACIGSHFATRVLKLLIATIYTNFTTSIIDDEGIEQRDGMIAGPRGGKLIIQFHAVSSAEVM